MRVAFNLYGALLRRRTGTEAVKTLLSIFGLASAIAIEAESALLAVTPPDTITPAELLGASPERRSKEFWTVTLKSTVLELTVCALAIVPTIKQKAKAKANLTRTFMVDEHWHKIEKFFNQAVLLTTGDRQRFVVAECIGDLALRLEIYAMLAEAQRGN